MPVTILVADDSATMRSILEMTFAGEDARVVAVDGGAAALEKALELRPDIVLADLSMEMDGYEVARAIKSELPGTAVLVLASQHTPYDEAKGRDAGVDDHIVKPFDTQNVIDRINRLAGAPRAAAAPGAHPYRDGSQAGPRPAPASAAAPPRVAAQAAPVAPPGTVAAPKPGVPRTTVAFGSAPVAAPAPPAPPRPPAAPMAVAPVAPPRPPAIGGPAHAMPVHAPAAPHAAPAAARPAAAIDAAASAMSEKLGGLGLTPHQADAVLALSREVIERVVWEVVPDLAETIIREELKRLTAS